MSTSSASSSSLPPPLYSVLSDKCKRAETIPSDMPLHSNSIHGTFRLLTTARPRGVCVCVFGMDAVLNIPDIIGILLDLRSSWLLVFFNTSDMRFQSQRSLA